MKEITKLQVQAKDKNRVNVYLDNQFFGGLDMETAVKYNLKVGSCISEQKLEEIQFESEKRTAYNKALKLLNIRRKTQKEINKISSAMLSSLCPGRPAIMPDPTS